MANKVSKVRITVVKSPIESNGRVRATLSALGVMKPHASIVKDLTPTIAGMIFKVKHLVKVEEL